MPKDLSKLMALMLDQFQTRHNRRPEKIVIAPVALVGLSAKKTVAPVWDGIPVECRLFEKTEVASRKEQAQVRYLGVFMKENRGRMMLRACDLKGP